MSVQSITIRGEQFVVVEKAEFDRLRLLAEKFNELAPPTPEPDEHGLRPALPTIRAMIARDIIQDRLAACLTQKKLARLAGVRPETMSRIEAGKHTPTEDTIARIDRALKRAAGTKARTTKRKPK